jgi:chemosensory pili system protein ChpA (sensor histidine kinase/response regulator)
LDIVHSTVAALGGHIRVDSQPGKGTLFTVTVPLTLAVTQVVIVRNGERTYAIPSTLIVQVERCTAEVLEAMYASRSATLLNETYGFRYLGDLLATAPRGNVMKRNNIVLMLRAGDSRLAVHVDDLLLNQELALKEMGPQLGAMPGVAGVTVGSDGRALLILNPLHIAARQAQFVVKPQLIETRALSTPMVLVVDDSVTVRKVSSRLLERAGYRVAIAKDGSEALERMREEQPVAILMDIEMPRMDGFELTRHVRADEATRATPIIMISSRTAEKHRVRAQELGVNVFLGKPFNDEALLGHLERLLNPHIQRSVA